jgi:uncharacterized membrane protein
VERELLPICIIVLMFAIAIYAEPLVITNYQGAVPVQWNEYGQATGWAGKAVALYLVPVLTAIFYAAFMLLPHMGVYRKEAEHFARQFWGFKVIFVFVMAVIYVATLLPCLGLRESIDPLYVIVPAIALIFFYVGYMLNFTHNGAVAGIKESRAAASERVWEKTNHFGGKLFWLCGALTLVALVAPSDVRLWMVVAPLVLAAIIAYLYSLYEYKKLRGELGALSGRKKGKRRKKRKAGN